MLEKSHKYSISMSPLISVTETSYDSTDAIEVKVKVEEQIDQVKGDGIAEPGTHDVLCGRGGNINTHPGNEDFRKLIDENKRVYLTARFKKDKRLITDSIIEQVQKRGGRFLLRDVKSGLWFEVTEDKARDKTSQALRENAPKIREALERENEAARKSMYPEGDPTPTKDIDYHNSLNHQNSPIRQSNASYRNELGYGQPGWVKSPDQTNSYYTNHQHGTPYNNGTTPRYNETKSFMETMTEAFVCPTSLDNIYSKTKPYHDSPHYAQNNHYDNPNQYSLGQKRSYRTSGSAYQLSNDGGPWGNQHGYHDKAGSPLFYRLPGTGPQISPKSSYSEQRNPKRTKGSRYNATSYAQQSQREYPKSFAWSPFSNIVPTARSNSFEHKSMYMSPEEGQEVQLVERIESMSMDCDDNNNDDMQMNPYGNRNQRFDYDGTSEVRTPPPPDDQPSSDYDWMRNTGGCHNIFCANMLGGFMNHDEEEIGQQDLGEQQISKVPSIDMNASLASLDNTNTEQISASDLNGASLVNVFSEGESSLSTKNDSSGKFSELNISYGDSLLVGDFMS